MSRINQYLVEEWKDLLAVKLGRPASIISENGLSATDFSCSQKVVLRRPHELNCTFENAFSVIDKEKGKVAVFTEHCGYHIFYLYRMKVTEVRTEEYWHEDYSE